MEKALIVFEKNKILGKVKTRLAVEIGNEKALNLYEVMVNYVHEVIQYGDQTNFIYYSEFIEDKHPVSFQSAVQYGKDLGERMLNAFIDVKAKGCKKVLIIGTDCIEIDKQIIEHAFNHLDNKDVVIGPALDGGYYLLGMNQIHIELFENMKWSTDSVFKETVHRCSELNLSIGFLPTLNDIDELEDLKKSNLSKN